jgi:hypothetical protein
MNEIKDEVYISSKELMMDEIMKKTDHTNAISHICKMIYKDEL